MEAHELEKQNKAKQTPEIPANEITKRMLDLVKDEKPQAAGPVNRPAAVTADAKPAAAVNGAGNTQSVPAGSDIKPATP